ncbi:hypothetical protein BV20DRAFT_785080 [Pilatotrama ljubarskyi]|nr:hypothetical protein BV20DRAFT_785080 [Pilatotrama ljubarskyi]
MAYMSISRLSASHHHCSSLLRLIMYPNYTHSCAGPSSGQHIPAIPQYPQPVGWPGPVAEPSSYHRGDVHVLSPKPTRSIGPANRPPVLDFTIQPGREVAHIMKVQDDGTVRQLQYNGKSYPIPLPPNTDTWEWKVNAPQTYGRGLPLSVIMQYGPYTEGLVNRIVENAQEFSPADVLSGRDFIDRGVFPNEFRPMTNSVEQLQVYGILYGELLARILEKQRDWYIDLINREHTEWYTHKHDVWRVWGANPMAECLWIVAIRRTLPDSQGRVFYFPEMELHPLA